MHFLRSLLLLLVPGVLYSTALYLHLQAAVPETWQPLIGLLPYLAVLAAAYFGWRFNRTRVISAILLMVLADPALMMSKPIDREFFLPVVSILAPLNLMLFNWWT
jgi:hypothetical protein